MIEISICLILISLGLGLLGPYVIWNRLSSIGDALSHSIMLSLVITYFFGCSQSLSSIVIACIFVSMMEFMNIEKRLDDSSKIISLSCLFISVTILASDISGGKIQLKEFMLGDVMSINIQDLYIIACILIAIIGFLLIFLDQIVLSSISEDLARIKGINVRRVNFFAKLLLCITIAVTANIVGILLITSLLVLPPSIARYISHSPRQMLLISSIISSIGCCISLFISSYYDFAYAPCLAFILSCAYFTINAYSGIKIRLELRK